MRARDTDSILDLRTRPIMSSLLMFVSYKFFKLSAWPWETLQFTDTDSVGKLPGQSTKMLYNCTDVHKFLTFHIGWVHQWSMRWAMAMQAGQFDDTIGQKYQTSLMFRESVSHIP